MSSSDKKKLLIPRSTGSNEDDDDDDDKFINVAAIKKTPVNNHRRTAVVQHKKLRQSVVVAEPLLAKTRTSHKSSLGLSKLKFVSSDNGDDMYSAELHPHLGQWHAKEPRSFTQKFQSFFVNTYVELAGCLVLMMALLYPTWVSFGLSVATQILLVCIPYHVIQTPQQRLKFQDIALKVAILVVAVITGVKAHYVLNLAGQDESYGIYWIVTIDPTSLVKSMVLDLYNTFMYETFLLVVLVFTYMVTRHLKVEVETSLQLKMLPNTFLGNRHFCNTRQITKYLLGLMTLSEVLSAPDLLGLPVLYATLLLIVLNITRVTATRNRQSFSRDSHFNFARVAQRGFVEYCMEQKRLWYLTVGYQQIVMMIQVFEYIASHTFQPKSKGEITQLTLSLQALRFMGHGEYQASPVSMGTIYQLCLTVFIIFFTQICTKAYTSYFKIERQDEINGEAISDLEKRKKDQVTQQAEKVLDATLKVYKMITFDRRRQTSSEFRKGFYGLLPVLLTWSVRISVCTFAYMYNSQVGLYHLAWVMASFVVPLRLFYTVSVIVGLPIVCIEFGLAYVSQIYQNASVYQDDLVKEFMFTPVHPFVELSLVYAILVLVGLMIPARLRFTSYQDKHSGGDMTKDILVRNVKDANSSILWKIVFILAVRLHTPVLFLMLFMGNSKNFNLFQLGFMFFFIAYGASHSLYVKTSIMLPLFVGFFIVGQYWWSLIYSQQEFMLGYNQETDFFYVVDGWTPPENPDNFYWARLPNITLWALFLLMHLLHTICKQFPDREQNQKYLAECESHIFDRIPLIAKYVKLLWDALFMLVLISVVFWAAKDLIQQKSNFINLIYLILFVVTFGKMCSTSLDGSSHRTCIQYATWIKRYSAIVLVVLTTYHMLRFEFFELNDWFAMMKEKQSFYLLYLTLFGFSEDESQTKSAVQLYTAYLIVGQIMHYHFDVGRQKHEGRDLYDWNNAFKTFKGVKRAHQFFQFDIAYMVYGWLSYWRSLDFLASYFHLLTSAVIVYFSVQVSISLFFAIHMSIIVFFYMYTSYKMHNVMAETIPKHYDMQQATDVCRSYKQTAYHIFLRSRQMLWMTQYSITLAFMFMGYLDDFVDQMHAMSNPEGTLVEKFEMVRFWLYWTGCYFPAPVQGILTRDGLLPVHFVFMTLLFEKQAQNWLQSRWGLNQTMISKFAKLEFLLNLEKKGKEWVSQDKDHEGCVKHPQDILVSPFQITVDYSLKPAVNPNAWMMEEFNNALVSIWRKIKLQSLIKRAIQLGFQRNFTTKGKLEAGSSPTSVFAPTKNVLEELAADEHVDTMNSIELARLELELVTVFQTNISLQKHWSYSKVQIEGLDCVLWAKMKDIILYHLYGLNKINQTDTTFLPYSLVKQLRLDIQQQLHFKFIDAAQAHYLKYQESIEDRVLQEKSQTKLFQLRRDLMKIVSRRYSYEMWGGMRLIFEQTSLVLLMLGVVIKCNIASIVYLILVTSFLLRESKQRVMRNMVYIVGSLFFVQYWVYLLNLTSESSPTPFPQMPYPNEDNPYGKYLIPIMYKFEFGRNMKHAYWYSFGVEIFTVKALWIDFITFAFVAIYLFQYRNPVLSTHCQSFSWCFDHKPSTKSETQHDKSIVPKNRPQVHFWAKLEEYHLLMNLKYPTEQEYGFNTASKRLRELKDNSPYYVFVRNCKVLIFTTMHIFTMIVILLMALCRRSFVSLGYVIALAPCLWSSATVLRQHEHYTKQQMEIEQRQENPEFQKLTMAQQQRIFGKIKVKYQWSFINLICVYLSVYSYMDFVSQVAYQVPYLPDLPFMEHFGLRKIYPPHSDSFDYAAFISGNYEPPRLNFSNLLMQLLNCVIMATISTQAELFKSKGYRHFLQKPNEGLDLLMKLAQLKKLAITYSYNNNKMTTILNLQKTEQQIFGCVDRIKLNMDMFRKSQQRQMLEEYCRTYGGMYIPPDEQPPSTAQIVTTLVEDDQAKKDCETLGLSPIRRLSLAITKEKQRREKLVTEQTLFVTKNVLPYRATIYLFLMSFSHSYIFIHRSRDMLRILSDMEQGRQNTGIDLIRVIRSDLFAILKQHEILSGEQLTEWPVLTLTDLRQTLLFCKWSHVLSRQVAALFRAVVSNTQTIAYACMLISMYVNAGLVSMIYPFAVFGYALLEETRPGKRFWRFMLTYSATVLLLKYLVNLEWINNLISKSNLPFVDGFVKFGLHHLEQTKDLVWHMLPEMMIVMSILCHEIVEQSSGLYDKTELEVETVPEAIDRIFKKHRKPENVVGSHRESQDSGLIFQQLDPMEDRDSQRSSSDQSRDDQNSNSSSDKPVKLIAKRAVSAENPLAAALRQIADRGHSERTEIQKKLDKKIIEIQEQESASSDSVSGVGLQLQPINVLQDEDSDDNFVRQGHFQTEVYRQRNSQANLLNTSGSSKTSSDKSSPHTQALAVKKSVWTSDYMLRIFPKVQQQKPGTDYYGYLTLVQCVLCYYLLSNFNQFSATSPYLEQDIFQTEMVIVLFFQIFSIILERYIARTENRVQVQRQQKTYHAVKPTINESALFLPQSHDDMTVRLVIQKLKFQHLQENIASLAKLRHEQDSDIQLSDSIVTAQQKCKFLLHWVNLILSHLYIFWYLPIQSNIVLYGDPNCGEIYGCKDFKLNESLQSFYIIYLLYFWFSARQISQGLPSFRRGSSTMLLEGSDTFQEEEDIGNALHQIFINLPLLAEIRCMMDFTLTKTAIDMWQTCQLFQYNSDFFIAKTGTASYNRKTLGQETSTFSKICFGYLCTTIMLSFILGPFVMFSSFGGMTMYNPVKDNDLQFWVQVNLTTTRVEGSDGGVGGMDQQSLPFKLYDNESPSIYDFDQQMYEKRHFGEWPETKFFSPDQVQLIVASYYSDTTWIASDSTRFFLQKYACIANLQSQNGTVPAGCVEFQNVTNVQNVSIGFQLKTLFRREGPAGSKDAEGFQQRNLDASNESDRQLLSQFSAIMTEDCSSFEKRKGAQYTLNITDFFMPKILLGESTTVEPIYFNTRETESEARRNILLTYRCKDQWSISTGTPQNQQSLEFTIFSQRIQVSWLQGYDIMTFYTGIVLLIGMYMRPVFIFNSNRAFIYEINYADPMLRLCESVHLSRARGDLKMEDENFRLLQDILRSPELLHALTGSNMKGGVAPSVEEQKSHLVPKAHK